jgi:hypothetical protein
MCVRAPFSARLGCHADPIPTSSFAMAATRPMPRAAPVISTLRPSNGSVGLFEHGLIKGTGGGVAGFQSHALGQKRPG